MNIKIGIIILNYNTPEDAEQCVRSIRENCSLHYRIFLVDNCSTDNSLEFFQRTFSNCPDIKIVQSEKNNGFSAGNNLGGNAAIDDDCGMLLFANSDILFSKDSIEALCEVLTRPDYDDVGIVGPRIETPDSKASEFARKKLTLKYYIKTKKPFCYFVSDQSNERYQRIEYDDNNVYSFNGMVSGCCLMMNAKLFAENCGFDESVFLYGEEDIWAYKLEKYNLKAAIAGDSCIFHNHHNSIKKRGLAFTRFYQWLSPLIVVYKYGVYSPLLFKIACFCNLITWDIYSIFFSDYRKMRKSFQTKILQLIKDKK